MIDWAHCTLVCTTTKTSIHSINCYHISLIGRHCYSPCIGVSGLFDPNFTCGHMLGASFRSGATMSALPKLLARPCNHPSPLVPSFIPSRPLHNFKHKNILLISFTFINHHFIFHLHNILKIIEAYEHNTYLDSILLSFHESNRVCVRWQPTCVFIISHYFLSKCILF